MLVGLLVVVVGVMGTQSNAATAENFHVELHLIEHTHDDVGWIKTTPDYYTSEVRNILDVATQGLTENSDRRFT